MTPMTHDEHVEHVHALFRLAAPCKTYGSRGTPNATEVGRSEGIGDVIFLRLSYSPLLLSARRLRASVAPMSLESASFHVGVQVGVHVAATHCRRIQRNSRMQMP